MVDGHEADYASIATAFIEKLRRGLEACGVSRQSSAGRQVAEEMCSLMYPSVAGGRNGFIWHLLNYNAQTGALDSSRV